MLFSRLLPWTAALTLAFLLIAWVAQVAPDAFANGTLQRIGIQIADGEKFRASALDTVAKQVLKFSTEGCYPETYRAAALVLYAQSEAKLKDGQLAEAKEYSRVVNRFAEASLSCAPARGYDWLVLYWVRAVAQGNLAAAIPVIRMEYQVGRYEGWLILRRLAFFFQIGAFLDDELKGHLADDFRRLLEERQFNHAAEVFSGLAPAMRVFLVQVVLTGAETELKEGFVRSLRERGDDIILPGTTAPPPPRYFR